MKVFKVNFILAPKAKKNGTKSVICRFGYGKDVKEVSTGIFCLPSEWDTNTQQMVTTTVGRTNNSKLAIIKARLLTVDISAQTEQKATITAELIKSMFEGKSNTNYSILALWDLRITNNQNVNEQERKTVGSFAGDVKKKNRLKRFLWETMKVNDLMITAIDVKFCNDYLNFLNASKLTAETVRMTYSRFATLMQDQHNLGRLTHNVANSIVPKRGKKKEVVYLTTIEIQKLVDAIFVSDAESKERDRFLIQIFTGVAHVDVPKICLANVQINSKGQEIIYIPRQKTSEMCLIPFNPLLRTILEKYPNGCLEQISNQKRNVNLAQICNRVGITKKVTTHIGRNTFCVYALNVLKLSITNVAKIMGHSSTETTQRYYMQIFDTTVTNEYFEALARTNN